MVLAFFLDSGEIFVRRYWYIDNSDLAFGAKFHLLSLLCLQSTCANLEMGFPQFWRLGMPASVGS